MSYLQLTPSAPPISNRLSLLWFRAQFVAYAAGPMPTVFGSTLYDAVSRTFKLTVCPFPDPLIRPCTGCQLLNTCPFPWLFEPQYYPRFMNLVPPQALTVAPGTITRSQAAPGTTLSIDLVQAGGGTGALLPLLATLSTLGRRGLGPARVGHALVRVDALNEAGQTAATVQIGDDLQHGGSRPIPAEAWIRRTMFIHVDTVELQAVTRMALQREGVAESSPPAFVDLIRALVRRADILARAYCGEADPFPDSRPWMEAAAQVQLVEARAATRREGLRPGSTVHLMPQEGFSGTLRYAAPPTVLAPFLPLLALGEALGVGRGCNYGNGRYLLSAG